MLRALSLLEARVLGVLVEKERTVPDSYPLTLNALVVGCNQKSSRDPVLNAAETDVQAAVDGLKSMVLAIERSGGRVARYAHNVERMMDVPQQNEQLLLSPVEINDHKVRIGIFVLQSPEVILSALRLALAITRSCSSCTTVARELTRQPN